MHLADPYPKRLTAHSSYVFMYIYFIMEPMTLDFLTECFTSSATRKQIKTEADIHSSGHYSSHLQFFTKRCPQEYTQMYLFTNLKT